MNRTLDLTHDDEVASQHTDAESVKPKRKMTPEALEKLKQARILALQKKQELKIAKQTIKEQEKKQLNEKAKQLCEQTKITEEATPDPPPSKLPDQVQQPPPKPDFYDYSAIYSKLSKIDELDQKLSKLNRIDEVATKFDIMMEEKQKRAQLKEQSRKEFYNQIPINIQRKMLEDEIQQKEIERFRTRWFGSHNTFKR